MAAHANYASIMGGFQAQAKLGIIGDKTGIILVGQPSEIGTSSLGRGM